jgi:molybdate-binding protein/DNA-binding XRE family transcriptional regulator
MKKERETVNKFKEKIIYIVENKFYNIKKEVRIMKLSNRVREYREGLGLSRAEVAESIGITRQSLGQIETNKVIPSTIVSLRLAQVFNVTVEALFYEEDESETAYVWPEDKIQKGDRIVLANIAGRRVARPATGINTYHTQPLTSVASTNPGKEKIKFIKPPNNKLPDSFIIAGCDLGLGLLAEHLKISSSSKANNVLWLGVDNSRALRQLTQSMVHVAAVHFPNHEAPDHIPGVTRIQFSEWEVGWLVKRGNPLNFRGVQSFLNEKIRLVNRPVGSGVRTLLDKLLKKENVSAACISQYDWEVVGHRQVAEAVATGLADVGVATASTASMLHLDFIPIQKEACELWFPKQSLMDPGVQNLLDTLNSDLFRWDLERSGPCDVTQTGNII